MAHHQLPVCVSLTNSLQMFSHSTSTMSRTLALLVLAVAFNVVTEIQGTPSQVETLLSPGKITDYDNYEKVKAYRYKLVINYVQDDGGSCFKQIIVNGKGIGDSFDIPCATNLHQTIYTYVSSDVLMYGDPTVDYLALFSDSPSTLMVIRGGECTKRVYTTVDRETSHTTSEFSDEACRRLSERISKREYEQQHHHGYY